MFQKGTDTVSLLEWNRGLTWNRFGACGVDTQQSKDILPSTRTSRVECLQNYTRPNAHKCVCFLRHNLRYSQHGEEVARRIEWFVSGFQGRHHHCLDTIPVDQWRLHLPRCHSHCPRCHTARRRLNRCWDWCRHNRYWRSTTPSYLHIPHHLPPDFHLRPHLHLETAQRNR